MKSFLSFVFVFFGAISLLTACSRQSVDSEGTLYIAAATSTKFAMNDIILHFRSNYPERPVEVTYGSSGNFHAQLMNQAPFDIFFSADTAYPQRLIDADVADQESLFKYASGRIALWVPHDSGIDLSELGMDALRHPSVSRIAIANPRHAPYGMAAEQAMRSFGIYNEVNEKLALAENIAQAAQFVESGAAQIGILAMSLAVAPAMMEKGSYWDMPTEWYDPIEQSGVILPWASPKQAAVTFRDFVLGEEGRRILSQYGFCVPESP